MPLPSFARAPMSVDSRRTENGDDWDVRIEATVTSAIHDDVVFAYKVLGFKNKTDWLRWVIVKELYGEVGAQRVRNGLNPEQPEDPR